MTVVRQRLKVIDYYIFNDFSPENYGKIHLYML